MKQLPVFILLSLSVFIFSCSSNEIGNSKDVNQEAIYFQYSVWGDEESGVVTVKLQYRFAGENGTSLLLQEPSKVEFDGKPVPADSSKFSGAYYEVITPVTEFAGKHNIVFTNMDGREYKEEFEFPAISLTSALPKKMKREDILLEVAGLKENEPVKLVLTDTSFYGRGIEKTDTVKGGKVSLSKAELADLKNGPVHFELIWEKERAPKEITNEGGRLGLSYGLKREFLLED